MSDLSPLLQKSASEIAALIRAKEVSPAEVVSTHIERAREVNPALNALAEERFDLALEEAAVQTELLATSRAEELPPFFGVPFTAKEMFAVQGMKRTAGSVHRRNEISDYDATVVARLKQAGAVLIGTTNVPELGFWFECENPIYGRTNNPYDLSRTSGGSSGGEGALIGAGASPFGVGSDIGGSIRMPAAFCGVYGHKPTRKRIPLTGHFPYSLQDIRESTEKTYPYTCSGFLARKAADLSPLLKVLSGPDQIDPQIGVHAPRGEKFDLSGIRVFVCEDPVFHLAKRADGENREAVRRSARLLEQYGAQVEEFDPRFFVSAVDLWFASIRSHQRGSFSELLSPHDPLSFSREAFSLLRGKGRYTVPSLLTALLEKAATGPERDETSLALLQEAEKLRHDFIRRLGPNGVLLLPVHPRTAPRHRSPWLSPFDFIFTAIFNIFEGPATACPVGLSDDGLPLSVQIVANADRDDLTIGLAEVLESAFGGWTPARLP